MSDTVYELSDFPAAWMRVLFRLYLARIQAERFHRGTKSGPPGYIPIYELRGPDVGGSAGDVRLRLDVRGTHRVPVDMESLTWTDRHGRTQVTPLYRLDCPMDDTDFAAILEEGADWRWRPQTADASQLELEFG